MRWFLAGLLHGAVFGAAVAALLLSTEIGRALDDQALTWFAVTGGLLFAIGDWTVSLVRKKSKD